MLISKTSIYTARVLKYLIRNFVKSVIHFVWIVVNWYVNQPFSNTKSLDTIIAGFVIWLLLMYIL